MDLNYKEFGKGQAFLIIHGFMGSLDNWQSFAKKLGKDLHVFTIDQRNHGQSEHTDEMNYELMSADIAEFIEKHNIVDPILLGHSMGGKVAMHVAAKNEDLLEKLVIVDMGTKEYPMHHDHILEGINAVTLDNVSARSEAEKQMEPFIESEGIKQFLLKNLYWKEKGQLSWRMNVQVLEREMAKIKETYPVIGMSCASCVRNVESVLNKTKGVIEANVNFASEKVTIEYDDEIINILNNSKVNLLSKKEKNFYKKIKSNNYKIQ